jgi:hypothetical protein
VLEGVCIDAVHGGLDYFPVFLSIILVICVLFLSLRVIAVDNVFHVVLLDFLSLGFVVVLTVAICNNKAVGLGLVGAAWEAYLVSETELVLLLLL